jgi:hypothetical protein
MTTLPGNIEKAVYHDGYAAWDGMGQPWRVTRSQRNRALWVAKPAPNHKSRYLPPVQGATLKEVAAVLASRIHAPASDPW